MKACSSEDGRCHIKFRTHSKKKPDTRAEILLSQAALKRSEYALTSQNEFLKFEARAERIESRAPRSRCMQGTAPSSAPYLYHIPSLYNTLSMPIQDRTNEFRACVDSIHHRSVSRGVEQKQRLLQKDRSSSKSEFSRLASAIGKDINNTTLKLNKLAQRTLLEFLAASAGSLTSRSL